MISSIPILSILIWTPILGGLILLFLPNKEFFVKTSSIFLAFLTFVISMVLLFNFDTTQYSLQYAEKYTWIKNLGINYHLAVDGFSLVFIFLSLTFSDISFVQIVSILHSFFNELLSFNTLFLFIAFFCLTFHFSLFLGFQRSFFLKALFFLRVPDGSFFITLSLLSGIFSISNLFDFEVFSPLFGSFFTDLLKDKSFSSLSVLFLLGFGSAPFILTFEL